MPLIVNYVKKFEKNRFSALFIHVFSMTKVDNPCFGKLFEGYFFIVLFEKVDFVKIYFFFLN